VSLAAEKRFVPVRVNCPHCQAPCLVAEQHLGRAVRCGRCGRSFTTRADPAAVTRLDTTVRLDIGAATSRGQTSEEPVPGFLVQQAVWCNLDKRQELAVLIVAEETVLPTVGVALMPLVDRWRSGADREAINIEQAVAGAAATVVVIDEGEVNFARQGAARFYLHRGGQLVQLTLQPNPGRMKLAPGDWLLVTDGAIPPAALKHEIETAACADRFAQQILERAREQPGGEAGTVVVVRCY
jgi:predicted Zn finger-like uncharacterized protein